VIAFSCPPLFVLVETLLFADQPTIFFDGSIVVGGENLAKVDVRKKLDISHVITCVSVYEESYPPDDGEVKAGRWLVIRLADAATSDLLSHLKTACRFVDDSVRNGGTVAIHSLEGVSRAASLLIAYLMEYRSMNLREAFDHVSSIRPDIRVNRGFWRQLHAYEYYLKGKNSIDEEDLPGAIIFEADAMAAIINQFKAKHPTALVVNPSPRKSVAKSLLHLTGGAFCGSPRKSKQPNTPKLKVRAADMAALEDFDLAAASSPKKKQRVEVGAND